MYFNTNEVDIANLVNPNELKERFYEEKHPESTNEVKSGNREGPSENVEPGFFVNKTNRILSNRYWSSSGNGAAQQKQDQSSYLIRNDSQKRRETASNTLLNILEDNQTQNNKLTAETTSTTELYFLSVDPFQSSKVIDVHSDNNSDSSDLTFKTATDIEERSSDLLYTVRTPDINCLTEASENESSPRDREIKEKILNQHAAHEDNDSNDNDLAILPSNLDGLDKVFEEIDQLDVVQIFDSSDVDIETNFVHPPLSVEETQNCFNIKSSNSINIKCTNCFEFGHMRTECKMAIKPAICYMCGESGHYEPHCPNTVCLRCGNKTEVFTRSCKACIHQDRLTCANCKIPGHSLVYCPDQWRMFHSTTKANVQPNNKVDYNPRRYCCICGESGHISDNCSSAVLSSEYPAVCSYVKPHEKSYNDVAVRAAYNNLIYELCQEYNYDFAKQTSSNICYERFARELERTSTPANDEKMEIQSSDNFLRNTDNEDLLILTADRNSLPGAEQPDDETCAGRIKKERQIQILEKAEDSENNKSPRSPEIKEKILNQHANDLEITTSILDDLDKVFEEIHQLYAVQISESSKGGIATNFVHPPLSVEETQNCFNIKSSNSINIKCTNCFEFGHMLTECKMAIKPAICYMCGESGHYEPHCPNTVCLRCGNKTEVFTRSCKACIHQDRLTCATCKIPGHSLVYCPDQWRMFHSTTKANVQPNNKVDYNPRRYCCICGESGHISDNCSSAVLFSDYPAVCSYVKPHEKSYNDVAVRAPYNNRIYELCQDYNYEFAKQTSSNICYERFVRELERASTPANDEKMEIQSSDDFLRNTENEDLLILTADRNSLPGAEQADHETCAGRIKKELQIHILEKAEDSENNKSPRRREINEKILNQHANDLEITTSILDDLDKVFEEIHQLYAVQISESSKGGIATNFVHPPLSVEETQNCFNIKSSNSINIKCTNCFEFGHMLTECKMAIKPAICYMCGESGHYEPHCPNTVCLRCGNKTEVFTRSCKACIHQDRLTCATCKIPGHSLVYCPDQWRMFHSTTKANAQPNNKVDYNPRRYCCICGESGHISDNCSSAVLFSEYPVMSSYVKWLEKPYNDVVVRAPSNNIAENMMYKPCQEYKFEFVEQTSSNKYYERTKPKNVKRFASKYKAHPYLKDDAAKLICKEPMENAADQVKEIIASVNTDQQLSEKHLEQEVINAEEIRMNEISSDKPGTEKNFGHANPQRATCTIAFMPDTMYKNFAPVEDNQTQNNKFTDETTSTTELYFLSVDPFQSSKVIDVHSDNNSDSSDLTFKTATDIEEISSDLLYIRTPDINCLTEASENEGSPRDREIKEKILNQHAAHEDNDSNDNDLAILTSNLDELDKVFEETDQLHVVQIFDSSDVDIETNFVHPSLSGEETQDRFIIKSSNSINIKCTNCFEFGHMRTECKMAIKPAICYMCGESGHYEPHCPNTVCLRCGNKTEVFTRSCKACIDQDRLTCATCKIPGHSLVYCPDQWRMFHSTTKANVQPNNKVDYNPRRYCCICGESGHISDNCSSAVLFSDYPAVCSYVKPHEKSYNDVAVRAPYNNRIYELCQDYNYEFAKQTSSNICYERFVRELERASTPANDEKMEIQSSDDFLRNTENEDLLILTADRNSLPGAEQADHETCAGRIKKELQIHILEKAEDSENNKSPRRREINEKILNQHANDLEITTSILDDLDKVFEEIHQLYAVQISESSKGGIATNFVHPPLSVEETQNCFNIKSSNSINIKCTNCFEFGHMLTECKMAIKPAICYMCGESGHYEPHCPNTVCLRCGNKTEVFTRSCKACIHQDRLTCATCKIPGHSLVYCPDQWRMFHSTTKANAQPNNKVDYNPRRYCCICGESGHISDNCSSAVLFSEYPVMSSYVKWLEKPYNDVVVRAPSNNIAENMMYKPCQEYKFEFVEQTSSNKYYERTKPKNVKRFASKYKAHPYLKDDAAKLICKEPMENAADQVKKIIASVNTDQQLSEKHLEEEVINAEEIRMNEISSDKPTTEKNFGHANPQWATCTIAFMPDSMYKNFAPLSV